MTPKRSKIATCSGKVSSPPNLPSGPNLLDSGGEIFVVHDHGTCNPSVRGGVTVQQP
jgi:hypothetical protein